MRIIYKSNKPECIVANHRLLTSDEGEELFYKRGVEFKLSYTSLHDFEANFGGPLTNASSDDSRFTNAASNLLKPVQTNSMRPAESIKSEPGYTVYQTSSKSASTKTKSKAGKVIKTHRNSLKAQSIQHAASLLHTYDYLGDVSKIEPHVAFDVIPMGIQNDYTHNQDYYNEYLNTINSYNYSNYLGTDSTNKFYNYGLSYQNGFLYNQTQIAESNWYEAANSIAPIKLTSSSYLTNHTHAGLAQQQAPTSLAMPTNPKASNVDLFHHETKYSDTNGTYLDDYHQHLPPTSDYNSFGLYGDQHTSTKSIGPTVSPSSFNTTSDINNNNQSTQINQAKHIFKNNLENKEMTHKITYSSSTPKSNDATYSATLQVRDSKTSTVPNGSGKNKYQTHLLINSDKITSTYNHDFNSVSSSCSSSASSSISNYCDETRAKFIK